MEDIVPELANLPTVMTRLVAELATGADPKRRAEKLELISSIKDAQNYLEKKLGYKIQRFTLYTRFLPRNPTTHEGRRHKHAYEVKKINKLKVV